MSKSLSPPRKKTPSPTNVSHFPTDGWMSNTCPTTCGVSGRIGTIIGYEDYYLKNEHVLCTCVLSVAAIATTIDDGASPLGSTELDDEMGHNCKMSKKIYTSFGLLVLGLNHDSWATACTERAFCNLLIQDIDTMMYYWDTVNYVNGATALLPDDRLDMARILALAHPPPHRS
jgi:hypothetical protein